MFQNKGRKETVRNSDTFMLTEVLKQCRHLLILLYYVQVKLAKTVIK